MLKNSNNPQNYTFTISVDNEQVESSNLLDVTIPSNYSIPTPTPTPTENVLASTVTVSGGAVSGDVFGGGKMGKTSGDAIVTLSGGEISGNVFGGAYGQHGSVYLAGLKTVNITGGHVNGSVYGGSRKWW